MYDFKIENRKNQILTHPQILAYLYKCIGKDMKAYVLGRQQIA